MKYFYSNVRDLKSSLRNKFHHMHSLPLNFTNNFRIPILLKTFFGKRLLRIHLNQYTIVSKRSCYQAKISCFPRGLQRNTFRLPRPLEDVFKTYLQYVFLKRLEEFFTTYLQYVFLKCLQDVFVRRLVIMSSRRLGRQKMLHWIRLENVFKTSSVRLHQDECLLVSVPKMDFNKKTILWEHELGFWPSLKRATRLGLIFAGHSSK